MSLPKPDSPSPWRGPVRAVGALSASVLALPLVGGAAHAATVPLPKPSRALPSGLDVAPPYERGTLCLTESQPGPIAFAKLLNATYGPHVYGVLRKCDQEHGEGRALDWMLDASRSGDLAIGNAVTRWLAAADDRGREAAMARRFGINYIIWNRQIWKAWDPGKGWQAYSGSSPHTDHIHISFTWDGAYQRTSWWTGVPVVDYLTGPKGTATGSGTGTSTSAPSDDPADYVNVTLRLGSRGQAVKVLQQAIGGLTVDGSFGPLTEARVRAYQKAQGLTVNGVVDSRVWNALLGRSQSTSGSGSAGSSSSGSASSTSSTSTLAKYAGTVLRRGAHGTAVEVLQKAIGGLAVDGAFGPRTEARVRAYQTSKHLPVNGVVDTRVWNALMGKATSSGSSSSGSSSSSTSGTSDPLARYSNLTLRLWSRGEAVKALQRALGGLVVDGHFGPNTLARVKAWQKSKGLVVDGVVNARDWKVLRAGSTASSASSSGSSTRATSSSSSSSSSATTELTRYTRTTLRRGSTGSAVRALQAAVGRIAVDGHFGPNTEARVEAVQRAAGLSATGVVDGRTWDAVERLAHPLLQYWGTVLKRGSHGTAVKALQRALGGLAVDGSYGPRTEAAVKAAQGAARIARTGVVGTVTWKAIEARMR